MSKTSILLSCAFVCLWGSVGTAEEWEINAGEQAELNGFPNLPSTSSWYSDLFMFEFGGIRIEEINDQTYIFAQQANDEWGLLGSELRTETFRDSFMASDETKYVYRADCHGSNAFIKRFEFKHDGKEVTGYSLTEKKVGMEGQKLHQCALVAKGRFVLSLVASITENAPGVLLAISSADGGDTWKEPVKVGETALGCFTRQKLAANIAPDGSVSIYDIGLDTLASGKLSLFRDVFTKHSGYIQTNEQARVMLANSYTLVRHASADMGKTWKTTDVKLDDAGEHGVLRMPIQVTTLNGVETLLYLLVSTNRSKPDEFILARRSPRSGKHQCDRLTRAADSLIGDPQSFQFYHLMKSRLVSSGTHAVFVQYATVGSGVLWTALRPLTSADAGKTWRPFEIWKNQSMTTANSDKKLSIAAAHDRSHIVLSSDVNLPSRTTATFMLGSYGPPAMPKDH